MAATRLSTIVGTGRGPKLYSQPLELDKEFLSRSDGVNLSKLVQHEERHPHKHEPLDPFKALFGDRVETHLKLMPRERVPPFKVLTPVLCFNCIYDRGHLFPDHRDFYLASDDSFGVAWDEGGTPLNEIELVQRAVEVLKQGKCKLVALGPSTSYLRLECTLPYDTLSAIFRTDYDWMQREMKALYA